MLLVKSKSCRLISWEAHSITNSSNNSGKRAQLQFSSRVTMCSSHSSSVTSAGYRQHKVVWIWTESKQVMTAAVERGWNTFIFLPDHRELATEWSCKWVKPRYPRSWIACSLFGFMPMCSLEELMAKKG